jgi:hypothetical protein
MARMRPAASLSRPALALLGLLALAACGGGGDPAPGPAPAGGDGPPLGQVAPEFALADVNPASTTVGTDVRPSQSRGAASAWYFGHAT